MASAAGMSAQMVGSAFVSQFYNVLHQYPHMVHRFYTDASSVIRADSGLNGTVRAGNGQANIHKVIMSSNSEGCRAEIESVDSQDSFGGSVLVVVTGVMHRMDGKWKFVQSFSLAPQERGFYVYNDILRYLGQDYQPAEMVFNVANNSVAPVENVISVTSAAEQQSVGAEEVRAELPRVFEDRNASIIEETCNGEALFHAAEVLDVERMGHSKHSVEENLSFEALNISEPRVADTFVSSRQTQVYDVRSSFRDLDTGKKSYASILRIQREATESVVDAHSNVAKSTSSYVSVKPQHISKTFDSVSHTIENTVSAAEGDIKSIYIRNLPTGFTEEQLHQELSKFGALNLENILLRSNKDGGLYAFAEFEESTSACSAIEASPIWIGGGLAYVEERKSMPSGGGGRGSSRGRGRGRGQDKGGMQGNGSSRFNSSFGSGPASNSGSRGRTSYRNGSSRAQQ